MPSMNLSSELLLLLLGYDRASGLAAEGFRAPPPTRDIRDWADFALLQPGLQVDPSLQLAKCSIVYSH